MKEFFHASRNIRYLKSFFREGAQAIGMGMGGQDYGFYVFENKKSAKNHMDFLKKYRNPLHPQGGILVGVKVDEKELNYPLWQFDYEAVPDLLPLLDQNKDLVIHALMNTPFEKIKVFDAKKTDRYGRFLIDAEKNGERFQKAISPADPGFTGFISLWQKTFDTLCQNPQFKKEYDALLKDSPLAAKKYTGEDSLPVSYLSYMQPQKDGHLKEIVLYTDSKPKEKQSCPFLKVILAQAGLEDQKKTSPRKRLISKDFSVFR